MTNIVPGAAGLKTKVFSMSQGYDDITTNARRFTIEKRGTTEPGSIAWRVIANDGAIETVGDERRVVSFQPTSTYFWRATWASDFRLTINEGGVTGRNVYDFNAGLARGLRRESAQGVPRLAGDPERSGFPDGPGDRDPPGLGVQEPAAGFREPIGRRRSGA